MPKLQNVTAEELKAAEQRAEDLCADLHDYARRIQQGYCDNLASPVQTAKNFTLLTRAAADLAVHVIAMAAMQEMRRETEELIRKRNAKTGA